MLANMNYTYFSACYNIDSIIYAPMFLLRKRCKIESLAL